MYGAWARASLVPRVDLLQTHALGPDFYRFVRNEVFNKPDKARNLAQYHSVVMRLRTTFSEAEARAVAPSSPSFRLFYTNRSASLGWNSAGFGDGLVRRGYVAGFGDVSTTDESVKFQLNKYQPGGRVDTAVHFKFVSLLLLLSIVCVLLFVAWYYVDGLFYHKLAHSGVLWGDAGSVSPAHSRRSRSRNSNRSSKSRRSSSSNASRFRWSVGLASPTRTQGPNSGFAECCGGGRAASGTRLPPRDEGIVFGRRNDPFLARWKFTAFRLAAAALLIGAFLVYIPTSKGFDFVLQELGLK